MTKLPVFEPVTTLDIGPDAQKVVNEAKLEMEAWINGKISNLRDSVQSNLREYIQTQQEGLKELEHELEGLSAIDNELLDSTVAGINNQIGNKLDVQELEKLRKGVKDYLKAREQRWEGYGRFAVKSLKSVFGTVLKLPV